MGNISFFQLPALNDSELRQLFALLMPAYIDRSCIACGFVEGVPLAIIATGNEELQGIIKGFAAGVKEVAVADIPAIQYHLTGDKALWGLGGCSS